MRENIESTCEQTGQKYPVSLLLRVAGLSRSAWYKKVPEKKNPGKVRNFPGGISDEELVEAIRLEIQNLPFHDVGYRKIHRYLQKSGLKVGKNRVYRLMKKHNLLFKAPGGSGSARPHTGRITTDTPDEIWATDGKKFYTQKEGWCWFFGVIEHFNSEIMSWHVAKIGNRFEAAKPVAGALQKRFGGLTRGMVENLKLRTDLGSPYVSKYFRSEMEYFGIEQSYTFARSPEANGIIERFHRTLNEQVFNVNQFADLGEASAAIAEFIENYNRKWILERLDYQSPREFRENYEESLLKKCA